MTYGRLDVFWPDGRFESYILNAASVSVGRSGGCTIVLDTDTISRYHMSITNNKGEITIADMDSANGTYVDGARLDNNETRALQGGEEIQIGHLRLIYHHVEDQPTVAMTPVGDDTQRIEREDIGFGIEVYGPEIAVPPGSHTSMEISINNLAEAARRFTVKVSGLPDGWARVNRPELEVNPDDIATVLVNIKPFRLSESAPGDYPVRVTVALKDDPEKKIEMEVPVRILPYSGFGMALTKRQVTAYDSFRLHLHNQGSIGLPLYIMGRNKDDLLQFNLSQNQVVLGPGQRLVVQGSIKPARRRIFGAPRDHTFDLLVRSRDEAAFLAAERGHYLEEAILPRWAAAAIAAMMTGIFALLAAALLLIFLRVTPPPEIADFQAGVPEIASGELLTLSWTAQNAETITISVDGEVVLDELPGDTSSVEIDTDDYNGDILIELVARSGERIDTATVGVVVFEPLVVELFEVLPQTMLRNVVGQIDVSWRVGGASNVRISGLEVFQYNVETRYPASGEIVGVPGIPEEAFTITLIAEGARGNSLESAVTVDLINPECIVTVESLTLHADPDPTSNVVSTVPEDVSLVVDRQDETGQWLRIRLEAGVRAWGALAGLDCAEMFNPADLKIEPGALAAPVETTAPDAATATPVAGD